MEARFVEGSVSVFVKTCVDIPRFLGCCRECPNYDKRWSCPPYSFSVEAIWKQYTSILLYELKIPINKHLRDNIYTQEELNEISCVILAPIKKQLTEELMSLEDQYPGSKALFAGACDLCKSCNKENGETCRHPEQMRYSIEALGGNVAQAVQFYFGDRILWAANGHLPEHYILLGGLLKP